MPSGGSCKPTEFATSDVNGVSRVEISAPIPEISDAENGKWPLDATDVGLIGISDMDDNALFVGKTETTSGELLFARFKMETMIHDHSYQLIYTGKWIKLGGWTPHIGYNY